MQVPSTTATTLQSNTETTQTSSASKASLDYTAFLRLLIAQMQNQDPTNPTDPAQWMGQIAAFSNVEQGIQTNAKLDSLMTSMALSQVDGLIGRTITSDDGTITGKIESVRIVSGGTVAVLDSGDQIMLGSGLKIS
ncbi:flagellar hook assembly protein FlgD [Microbacteriaceae bacterium K1510]|nr:flagellar hook assembly protein FlgD [Microbacteriaceae bacterium K1510]